VQKKSIDTFLTLSRYQFHLEIAQVTMSRLLRVFGASLLFSALSACGDIPNFNPAAGLQEAKRNVGNAKRSLGSMPLDGRSLLDSWLGKRAFICNNAGYSPCPGKVTYTRQCNLSY
jgi:hypothetical protein